MLVGLLGWQGSSRNGKGESWAVAQLLYRRCGLTDESGCRWSPWERLLKVSLELRCSEKSILG
eukprot:1561005-Ditylum_brightwellii.AAC.1